MIGPTEWVFRYWTVGFNTSFALLLMMNFCFFGKKQKLGFVLLILSTLNTTLFLSVRWITSGYFPTTNLYESIVFLSWCVCFALVCLPLQLAPGASTNVERNRVLSSVFTFGSPLPLFLHTFASLRIPNELTQINPLIPALKSNWLIMHVSVMIGSYAALLIGSILSMILLWKLNMSSHPTIVRMVDSVSYQFVSAGFSFLTLGIVSGAVWANQAWGSYWSWDIKESWSLITWILYAGYIHSRLHLQKVEFSAWISSSAFFIVWISYLGVNLLGVGLHTYGQP
jgi:ABC-type transport system involved in cytochrome c biogenesis permease subunit